MSDFTNRIDFLLTKTHQRRADLCRGTGIPDGTIRGWIKGKTPPIDSAIAISKYFNCSLEWLVTGEESLRPAEKNFLSEDENDLVNYFRLLDSRDRDFLMMTAKNLSSRAKEEKKVAELYKTYGDSLV